MDTGILLKIIDDIQDEEQTASVQSLLSNISSYYSQNNPVSLNMTKETLRQAVTTSRLSQYALSDYEALERLEVSRLFGPGLYQRLQDILGSQAHEVSTSLQQLISERNTALTSLSTLQKSLMQFHFKSRALDDHNYEIGFMLPDNYSELEKTEEALEDFRLFLHALSNAIGEPQPLQIKYVSNGTIEIFLKSGVDLAHKFGDVIDFALKIYATVKAFDDIKKAHKSYSDTRKREADKIADTEKKEQTSKLIDEMIAALGISEPDDKNRVKELFKKFLKHIEAGVGAEVHTPRIEAPTEPSTDAPKEEKDQYKEALGLYEKKAAIDAKNREIFILQQNNFYGMNTKFLNAHESTSTDTDETGV